jgi:hypothetical protein
MQLIEQGKVEWNGSSEVQQALKLRHLYLAPSPKASKPKTASPSAKTNFKKKDNRQSATSKSISGGAKRVCLAYNSTGSCDHKLLHGNFQHKCQYCMKKTAFYFNHSEVKCERKRRTQGEIS